MNGDCGPTGGPRLTRIEAGEWAGWSRWSGADPYEDSVGPFYFRAADDGGPRCAFRAERRHMNGDGFMHGGCLMTFADFALFVIAREALGDDRSVTATFNGEFVGAVPEGVLVEGEGEVIKSGRSMIFVRGLITTGRAPVMSFSGVIKKTGPRNR